MSKKTSKVPKDGKGTGNIADAHKLSPGSLKRLYETRARILGDRVLVTNSTETLRRFRTGGESNGAARNG